MKFGSLSWVAATAATLVLSGCNPPVDSAEATQPAPPTVKFAGKVNPKFAGSWSTKNGESLLKLGKDGVLQLETISHSMKGKTQVTITGQWLAEANRLNFQYADKKGQLIVLQYTATLSGSNLNLDQAGGRLKTTYVRR